MYLSTHHAEVLGDGRLVLPAQLRSQVLTQTLSSGFCVAPVFTQVGLTFTEGLFDFRLHAPTFANLTNMTVERA